MAGGRPLKYNNCLDLDGMCHLYFEECEDNEKHPTVSGLAYFLDVDRKTLINYQRRDEFFHTIKRAKGYIESYLEQWLYGNSVTGVIFNLKNNFDWKDKAEVGVTPGEDANGNKLKWQVEIVEPKPQNNDFIND